VPQVLRFGFGPRQTTHHPAVFGYHEVWDTFLIGATACHFTPVLLLVHP
jgi:predicted membrane channel-forming protein YqfA (hemolysin III family)